jgi:hypothetical protein
MKIASDTAEIRFAWYGNYAGAIGFAKTFILPQQRSATGVFQRFCTDQALAQVWQVFQGEGAALCSSTMRVLP